MAPEMLSEVFPEGYEGRKCDMWSLGVTFYAILFQTLPFYEELLIKLFDKIEKCDYALPEKYNPDYAVFVPLIQRLLRINPNERLTADELVAELEKL
jgi:[calcium/calmodulin-dependent protein kinase] kinase